MQQSVKKLKKGDEMISKTISINTAEFIVETLDLIASQLIFDETKQAVARMRDIFDVVAKTERKRDAEFMTSRACYDVEFSVQDALIVAQLFLSRSLQLEKRLPPRSEYRSKPLPDDLCVFASESIRLQNVVRYVL